MNVKLEEYIEREYKTLQNISMNITNGNKNDADELLHGVLLSLLDRTPSNFDKFKSDNDFKYYIVRCLSINWYSPTSPYHRKYKRETSKWEELFVDQITAEDMNTYDWEKENLICAVEKEFAELDILHKGVFELYLTLGSMKKVAKQTKIPISSISRYIKESRTQIINNIKEN